ncbi:MAG: GNAT family N-acetyltransferase [Pseudomonadota bacterium]
MSESMIQLVPYQAKDLDEVLALSVAAWTPVLPKMEREIPDYVYASFYPEGWTVRQLADITEVCNDDQSSVWLALIDQQMTGYMALRVHEEDAMGELYVIAVHPAYQRRGVGAALMSFAFDQFRQLGLAMVMVETGGDDGHAPARAAYEKVGFERYPVARYFKKL